MPTDNASFLTVNGKRRVLVVDDEASNREILAAMLGNEYEVIGRAERQPPHPPAHGRVLKRR